LTSAGYQQVALVCEDVVKVTRCSTSKAVANGSRAILVCRDQGISELKAGHEPTFKIRPARERREQTTNFSVALCRVDFCLERASTQLGQIQLIPPATQTGVQFRRNRDV